ncbi:unnamed protein product [Vitrella brassicaformis CCMP3155]|uniref:START domain-containing protein n=2 Tax=Vitrella brassicaformis TaxID=1169539 RepID=A0A0G4F7I4_VITBC|nr:unnamed protein product [Vitrella brassicaformis CCMP3155]|eukprot:CEM08639.1 unnamed protein product [Vitrella brassicaformis CCMP3155]
MLSLFPCCFRENGLASLDEGEIQISEGGEVREGKTVFRGRPSQRQQQDRQRPRSLFSGLAPPVPFLLMGNGGSATAQPSRAPSVAPNQDEPEEMSSAPTQVDPQINVSGRLSFAQKGLPHYGVVVIVLRSSPDSRRPDPVRVKLQQSFLQILKDNRRLTCRLVKPRGGYQSAGLLVVAVGAVEDALPPMAEEQEVVKQTLTGKWTTFKKHLMPLLKNGDDLPRLFTPAETVELVRRELYAMRYSHDAPYQSFAGLRVMDVCHQAGAIEADDVFPVHRREILADVAANWRIARQPLKKVVHYFGFPMGYYFAFLNVYSNWLIYPAALGIIFFLADLIMPHLMPWAVGPEKQTPTGPIFAIIMALWSSVFVESWKRQINTYRFRWGAWRGFWHSREKSGSADWPAHFRLLRDMRIHPAEDRELLNHPKFHFLFQVREQTERAQAAITGIARSMTGTTELFSHQRQRRRTSGSRIHLTAAAEGVYWKHLGILLAVLLIMASTGFTVFCLLELQEWVNKKTSNGLLTLFPTVLYVMLAIVLQSFYTQAASFLTSLEGHRTISQYQSSFVVKNALFQLLNFLGYYIYLAFAAKNLKELSTQLYVFFIVKQVFLNLMELVRPSVQSMLRSEATSPALDLNNPRREPLYGRIMKEASLAPSNESDEYLELAVQFGVTAMFSAVFPLAPLFGLVNNLQEIRSDSFKACRLSRRPFPSSESVYQSWVAVYEGLSIVGVVSNCALLGILQGWSFGTILIIEHLLLFFKAYLAWSIPDVPEEVQQGMIESDLLSTQLAAGSRAPSLRTPSPHTSSPLPQVPEQPSPAALRFPPSRSVRPSLAVCSSLGELDTVDDMALETPFSEEDFEPYEIFERECYSFGMAGRAAEGAAGAAALSGRVLIDYEAIFMLEGSWRLLRDVSDSMEPIMAFFGVPWVKRMAMHRATPTCIITLGIESDAPSGSLMPDIASLHVVAKLPLGITKTNEVPLDGRETEHFDEDSGLWKTTAWIDRNRIVVKRVHQTREATLVETRQLFDPSSRRGSLGWPAGNEMVLRYQFHLTSSSPQLVDLTINRYFVQEAPSAIDRSALLRRLPSNYSDSGRLSLYRDVASSIKPSQLLYGTPASAMPDSIRSVGVREPVEMMDEEEPKPSAEELEEMERYTIEGRKACEALYDMARSDGWKEAGRKDGAKLYRKDIPNMPMMGRGTIEFQEEIPVQTVFDYIWDPDTKPEYDPMLDAGFSLHVYPNELGIMYQAFRGQYGVPGRDFIVMAWKESFGEDHMILGFKSIDWPDDDRMSKKHVRGKCILGGFEVRRLENGHVELSYFNQADLCGNISEWLVTQAKLDQLKIVTNVKRQLIKKTA